MVSYRGFNCVLTFCLCLILFVSCIKSEDSKVELTNDCAVSNVVLGTLSRVVRTKTAAGLDSSYVTSISGSLYKMYIDHLKREIYNPDSLPMGTNVNKVVFSTFSSDGTLAYRKDDGKDTLYATTDTLDMSNPRMFTCYAYTGVSRRSYNVKVNVHKCDPEGFVWNRTCQSDALSGVMSSRTFDVNDSLKIFAMKGGEKMLFVYDKIYGELREPQMMCGSTPDNLADVVKFNDEYYGVSDGKVVFSENGVIWSCLNAQTLNTIDAIVACSDNDMYALSDGCLFVSNDGRIWNMVSVIDSMDNFPVQNFSFSTLKMNFNRNFEYILLSGWNKSGKSVLWKRVIDRSGENVEGWSYYGCIPEVKHPLPLLCSASMIAYDGRQMYIGIEGDSLSAFYVSEDCGRNWLRDTSVYVHPWRLGGGVVSCITDEDNFIWLILAGKGEIWRGRMNRLGFADRITVFDE